MGPKLGQEATEKQIRGTSYKYHFLAEFDQVAQLLQGRHFQQLETQGRLRREDETFEGRSSLHRDSSSTQPAHSTQPDGGFLTG